MSERKGFDQIVKGEKKSFEKVKSPVSIKVEEEKTKSEVESVEEIEQNLDNAINNPTKKPVKIGRHFYLEEEISNVLDEINEENGGRMASYIVNEALRRTFVKNGRM